MDRPTPRLRPDTSRARQLMAQAMVAVVVVLILGNGVPVRALALPHPGDQCPSPHLMAQATPVSAQGPGLPQRQHTAPGTASGETCHHHDASPAMSTPAVLRAVTTASRGPTWTTTVDDATSHSPELPPPRA